MITQIVGVILAAILIGIIAGLFDFGAGEE